MTNAHRIIAMWSGPRNISTAMMRAWGNRTDTVVVDEPLYAAYLFETGYDHPGREEIIAADETDWRKVVVRVTTKNHAQTSIFYQKHMTHHILPDITLDWLGKMTNCFLIRDPKLVITSYHKVIPNPGLADLGFVQQKRLFDWVCEATGTPPPVLDAADVLKNPRDMLQKLCSAINVPFDEVMLSWEAGKRDTDGVWAKYWYAAVEQSTGFQPYQEKQVEVPPQLQAQWEKCQEIYQEMHSYRIV